MNLTDLMLNMNALELKVWHFLFHRQCLESPCKDPRSLKVTEFLLESL